MRTALNVVIVIIVAAAYQVVAYVIAKFMLPFILIIPPYSFVGEGFNQGYLHVVLGLVALLLALYSYPVDLQSKHQNQNRGNKNG